MCGRGPLPSLSSPKLAGLILHLLTNSLQLCKVLNSTLLTCPSPGALSNDSAPVDFFINGLIYVDEMGKAEEQLDPENMQRSSRFRLDYLPDPQFSTAKRERWIKHHPGEPLTLVIHVSDRGVGSLAGGSAQPGSVFLLHPHAHLSTEGAGQSGAREPGISDQDWAGGL